MTSRSSLRFLSSNALRVPPFAYLRALALLSPPSAIERIQKATEQKVDRVDHDPLDSATSFLFPWTYFFTIFPLDHGFTLA